MSASAWSTLGCILQAYYLALLSTDSIICDVHITETYVVGLFLELTVVLLVAAVLLLVTRWRCKYRLEEESQSHTLEEDGNPPVFIS